MALTLLDRIKYSRIDKLILRGGEFSDRSSNDATNCYASYQGSPARLPTEIGELPQITTIELHNFNKLDWADTFQLLAKVKTLTTLIIRHCQLQELVPEIAVIKNLAILDVSNETFGGNNHLATVPIEFCNLKYLHTLKISNNLEFKSFPPEIANAKKLKTISLRGFNHLPSNIELIPNLNKLDLANGYISPAMIKPLIDRPDGLKYVNVSESAFNAFKGLTTSYPDFQVSCEQGPRLAS